MSSERHRSLPTRRARGRLWACLVAASTVAVAALFAPAALGAGEQAAGARRPALPFVGTGWGDKPADLRTWYDWLGSGFEVEVRSISSVKSRDDLKPCNVVVINSLPSIQTNGSVEPEQIVFERALDQHVRGGGGVVVFAGGGEWERMSGALRHLLEPYGARVPEEQVVDPEHLLTTLDGQFKVNSTTQSDPP